MYAQDCQRDTVPPVPYCDNGVLEITIDDFTSVTIYAEDLNEGSFDNCTAQEDIIHKVRIVDNNGEPIGEPGDSVLITCTDVRYCGGLIELQLFAIDESGNKDYCTTHLPYSVPEYNCSCYREAPGGDIHHVSGTPISFHEVQILSDIVSPEENILIKTISNNGIYAFNFIDGIRYIRPVNNQEPVQNVDIEDLIKLMNFIYGRASFNSVYDYIAADADNNKQVNILDVIELQNLILSQRESFSNNTSWRYVPTDYLLDVNHPYDFIEYHEINTGDEHTEYDFTAIKIGDVNQDFGSFGPEIVTRNTLQLIAETSSNGREVVIKAKNIEEIEGLQCTWASDQRLQAIRPGALNISADFYNIHDDHRASMLWYSDLPVRIHPDTDLFTLVFEDVVDDIHVTSDVTRSKAILSGSTAGISLAEKYTTPASIDIHQNLPNPFTEETILSFDMDEPLPLTLTIFNAVGEVLWQQNIAGNRGLNTLSISDKHVQNAFGVLYYQLSTDDLIATQIMVRLH